MAEGGKEPIENGISEEGFVTSPVISPLVRELNSDQLMTIADDEALFSQVLNQMTKHKECGEICNVTSVPSTADEFFAHSTPVRSIPAASGASGVYRGTVLESRSTRLPLPSRMPTDQESRQAMRHKKYLMVIRCQCQLF